MKYLFTLSLLSISGLFFSSAELSAWERSAMKDCKADEQACKQNAQSKDDRKQCKMDMDDCKKYAEQNDADSFENALSPLAASQFRMFTPKQKKQAMDKADGGSMSPNNAVAKIYQDNR